MLFGHVSYRNYLKEVLTERISRNPSYSLRAMASQLGIAPSSLSEVLKGSKNLSHLTAFKIADKLGLKADEAEYFCLMVQAETTRSPEMKESLHKRLQAINPKHEAQDLSIDVFRMIADWYHISILEMTSLDGFEFSPRAIAKRLGIREMEARVALERLERLELIEKDKHGHYRKTQEQWVARSEVPNSGLRKYHRQMLEKAIESLDSQTPQEKIVGSETFALDPKLLNEARAITEKYFSEMVRLSRKSKKKSQVYHLGIQFFNLTKEGKS